MNLMFPLLIVNPFRLQGNFSYLKNIILYCILCNKLYINELKFRSSVFLGVSLTQFHVPVYDEYQTTNTYIDGVRVEPILAGVSSGLIVGTDIKFFLSLILDSSVIFVSRHSVCRGPFY